jgi:hypothetical protein
MRRLLPAVAALLLTAGPVAGPAWAAPYVFDLFQGNAAIVGGGGAGPYAMVTVNLLTSTSATVTFDALGQYALMDGGSAAVNINGTASVTGFSGTKALGATQATYSNGGPGNEDGFGNFELSVNSSDGWASRSAEIVMDLAATGGTTWASADQVLEDNSDGWYAAAHIGYSGGSITGYAASNGQGSIPEPMSIALLGAGLIGLGALRIGRLTA